MTEDIEARLREALTAWIRVALRDMAEPAEPLGDPRLGRITNRILDAVNAHPAGIRASQLIPLVLTPGEPLPDPESERFKKLCAKVKTYLQRLRKSGRIERIAIGLYAPIPGATTPVPPELLARLGALADTQATPVTAEPIDHSDPSTSSVHDGPNRLQDTRGCHDDPPTDDALALLLAAADPAEEAP